MYGRRWLSVKSWLVQKKHRVVLASRRRWKTHWVTLRGTRLLFYVNRPCTDQHIPASTSITECPPQHVLGPYDADRQCLFIVIPRLRSRCVAKVISGVCDCVCVRAVKGKRLEQSTTNLVHVNSVAVARHVLTHRSKGRRSRSHGYENRHGHMAAVAVVLLLPAWVCTSYDCVGF